MAAQDSRRPGGFPEATFRPGRHSQATQLRQVPCCFVDKRREQNKGQEQGKERRLLESPAGASPGVPGPTRSGSVSNPAAPPWMPSLRSKRLAVTGKEHN